MSQDSRFCFYLCWNRKSSSEHWVLDLQARSRSEERWLGRTNNGGNCSLRRQDWDLCFGFTAWRTALGLGCWCWRKLMNRLLCLRRRRTSEAPSITETTSLLPDAADSSRFKQQPSVQKQTDFLFNPAMITLYLEPSSLSKHQAMNATAEEQRLVCVWPHQGAKCVYTCPECQAQRQEDETGGEREVNHLAALTLPHIDPNSFKWLPVWNYWFQSALNDARLVSSSESFQGKWF